MTVETDEVAAWPMPCEVMCTLPELTDEAGCPEDESSNEEDVVGWLAYEAGETESCERGSPSMGPVCVGGRQEKINVSMMQARRHGTPQQMVAKDVTI